MIANPGREPSADVAAAGDSREIIEFLEHARARQPLQHTEAETGAADAAPGEAKRGALRFQRMNPCIDSTESRVFFCFGTRLRDGGANFAREFFFENVCERFRRF